MTKFTYDVYGRTEPSRIYLARPGKRILGCLNGTDPDSCNLTLNFINAHDLSFDVYKYHDEELTAYYDYIDILMEIYVDGFGWFFIDESPTTHNDGIKEYKTVTAKSYEYTLHQYDLVGFDINTASPTSREMLATDNVYTYSKTSEVWYNLFRDRVLFYRDTSEHNALLKEMEQLTTYEELQELLAKYPNVIYQDWRITISIDKKLRAGFVKMKDLAKEANKTGEADTWEKWINNYDNSVDMTSDSIKTLLLSYPELVKYIKLDFNKKKYTEDYETGKYIESESDDIYTAYQLMEIEYKRIKELSLLDLVISDVPGWEIDEVDKKLYNEHSDVNGTPVLLQNEVGSFEIDSQDVYSFLITELSGYFNCVFIFDTINNKINAYRIESLGIDTKIFLGFRNVQNSIDITPSQDLYTQFTVENSEGLSIPYVNFGQREIEDISYFLNTKYLPQELIDKYKRWLEAREEKRPTYIQLSRDYNTQYEKVQEIKNKVPSDMLNISQLDNYKSQDQLEEVIDNYYALMVGILNGFIYVATDNITPPKSRDLYENYNDYIDDWNSYIDQLYELVDLNKDSLATSFKDSLYYNDYKMMRDFTVPNLVISYNNLSLYSYENKTEYYDAYEFQFDEETYGDQAYGYMYGVDELKVYQKSHADKMDVYKDYAVAWESIPDTTEGKAFKAKYTESDYKSKHDLYIKYKKGYDSATKELEKRTAEYKAEIKKLEEIDSERQRIADILKMENYSEGTYAKVFNEVPQGWFYQEEEYYLTIEQDQNYFTNAEIEQLTRFFRHTDYVNDNINYLDKIDSTDDVIDKQLEMYKEAVEELYAESHPQYTYTDSVDNLLANNEYELYHPDFEVGNFIRLGLDDETQIQLRMIAIQFNPMIYDNELQITFSNMIQYRSRRDDFTYLFNSAITSAKNSITARYNRQADADDTVQVTYDLIQKILQSSPFTAVTQNIQAGSVTAATGAFQTLSTSFLKTEELVAKLADITELHSDSAFIKYLESNLVVAKALEAESAKLENLDVSTVTSDSGIIKFLNTNLVVKQAISAQSVKAENIDTETLTSDSSIIKYLESNFIATKALEAESVKAQNIDTSSITANDAFMKFIQANSITTDVLKSKLADVDILTVDSAFVKYLQSMSSTTATSVIDDAYIRDAVVGKISVADLLAGNIVLTDTMKIISQNKNGGNVYFNGSTLQFTDKDDNIGIQIGYGSQEFPHILITDKNGTSLWTSTGITADAIADELIVDNMIKNSTISKEKLGFEIVEPNAYGGIDISKIYDGSGNSFGVDYTSFKNNIESKMNYTSEIISTNGNMFKNGNGSTLLTCVLRSWGEIIDDPITGNYTYIWSRILQDGTTDSTFSATGKTIVVNASDINQKCTYICEINEVLL